jgi:hypothetical protein
MSAVRIFKLRVTLHPLYYFGRPFEVSLLPSRMRLKVSGQIYEVGDYFNADLQRLNGTFDICGSFRGIHAHPLAPVTEQ